MAFAYQQEDTQSGLFFRQADNFGDDVFMTAKFKGGLPCDKRRIITWRKAAEEARCLGAGLIGKGIEKEDRIGIFSHNRPRWVVSDQAIQGAGAIGVPIYPTSTDRQLMFILNDCEAKAVIAGDEASDYMIAGEPMPPALGVKFMIANLFVYHKIRQMVGFDRLILAGSGGAALSREITKFFRSMNITITEGYGLTETTSAISSNAPVFTEPLPDKWIYRKAMDWLVDTMVVMQGSGKSPFSTFTGALKMMVVSKKISPRFIIKPGFVGRPCKDTEIKIAEDGEVLAKGPQIFSSDKGYFKQPVKTEEVFTKDGFFRTGDIGEIDEDGFLKITDRKKELIVTSGGKNIAPHPIEMALNLNLYIDQVCVIGDGRNYITALIVPNFELLETMAREKGVAFNKVDDLVCAPEIIRFFDDQVATVNQNLARYEQIKKYSLLSLPFSEESGELTPTQKMKRRVIFENYKSEIDSLYK